MKSIAFLQKAWKKWAAYHRDGEQASGRRRDPHKSFSMNILPKSHSPYQSCDDRPLLHRNISRFALDTTCLDQGSPPTSQSPIRDCDQLPRLSSQPYLSTDHSQNLIPSCKLAPKDVENAVSYQKPFPVLQPLDVSNNIGSMAHPYNTTNHARSTDTFLSTSSSNEVQQPTEPFHAALDLLVDAKPPSLYHRTRSMPYLPYGGELTKSIQAPSVSSVCASEGNFPLSLFPTPPPFITRKRIPPPLVLPNHSPPTSPQSSRDSTPVGTPTTPRFTSPRSPSQSSFGSSKKLHSGRRVTLISPPPFNPPNSPLPSPPVCHEDNGRSLHYAGRPMRTAYSSSNLKDVLPFTAAHRLTFSESISDQSSLPIKKSRKPRPQGMRAERLQACLEMREQGSLAAVENNVQWGYAF